MQSNNPYQRWFVSDYHAVAGRPKMEYAIFNIAQQLWLHCSVYETEIPEMVRVLNERQDRILAENKRLKRVTIRQNIHPIVDTIRRIRIGEQYLTLTKIREEIECVTDDCRVKADI